MIYYTSIKQRERKYFRQLIFIIRDYSAEQRRTACLQTTSTRCQNQSSPWICFSNIFEHKGSDNILF